MVQIADLFTGTVARAWRRDSKPEESTNAKDIFTDFICEKLGLEAVKPLTPEMQDFTMIELMG